MARPRRFLRTVFSFLPFIAANHLALLRLLPRCLPDVWLTREHSQQSLLKASYVGSWRRQVRVSRTARWLPFDRNPSGKAKSPLQAILHPGGCAVIASKAGDLFGTV